MRPRTVRQTETHTDTQTRVTIIHFASSTTHAKCNNLGNSIAELQNGWCERIHGAGNHKQSVLAVTAVKNWTTGGFVGAKLYCSHVLADDS